MPDGLGLPVRVTSDGPKEWDGPAAKPKKTSVEQRSKAAKSGVCHLYVSIPYIPSVSLTVHSKHEHVLLASFEGLV